MLACPPGDWQLGPESRLVSSPALISNDPIVQALRAPGPPRSRGAAGGLARAPGHGRRRRCPGAGRRRASRGAAPGAGDRRGPRRRQRAGLSRLVPRPAPGRARRPAPGRPDAGNRGAAHPRRPSAPRSSCAAVRLAGRPGRLGALGGSRRGKNISPVFALPGPPGGDRRGQAHLRLHRHAAGDRHPGRGPARRRRGPHGHHGVPARTTACSPPSPSPIPTACRAWRCPPWCAAPCWSSPRRAASTIPSSPPRGRARPSSPPCRPTWTPCCGCPIRRPGRTACGWCITAGAPLSAATSVRFRERVRPAGPRLLRRQRVRRHLLRPRGRRRRAGHGRHARRGGAGRAGRGRRGGRGGDRGIPGGGLGTCRIRTSGSPDGRFRAGDFAVWRDGELALQRTGGRPGQHQGEEGQPARGRGGAGGSAGGRRGGGAGRARAGTERSRCCAPWSPAGRAG